MFREYFGEFLIHPAAIEFTGDYCSHSCFYCFANLNAPNHKADKTMIATFLRTINDRDDNVALLMRKQYPVFISNHVDLFSTSNKWLLDIVYILTEIGVPIIYQTRFGYNDADFHRVKSMQKALWQVTIETHDDDIAKKLSPGAPPISKRIENIKMLLKEGHLVTVNMLPFSKYFFGGTDKWKENLENMLNMLMDIGVSGVWFNPLHLTTTQKRRIKKYPKDVLPEEQYNNADKVDAPSYEIFEVFYDSGINFYSPYFPYRFNIFEGVEKLYPVRLPTLHEYWDGLEDGDLLSCEEFLDLFGHLYPEGVYNLRNYLIINGYDETLKRYVLPTNFTYHDLVKMRWGFAKTYDINDVYSLGLTRNFLFLSPIFDRETNNLVVDDFGCLVYAVSTEIGVLRI